MWRRSTKFGVWGFKGVAVWIWVRGSRRRRLAWSLRNGEFEEASAWISVCRSIAQGGDNNIRRGAVRQGPHTLCHKALLYKKFLHNESIYDLVLHKCLDFISIIRSIHFAYVAKFEWLFYPLEAKTRFYMGMLLMPHESIQKMVLAQNWFYVCGRYIYRYIGFYIVFLFKKKLLIRI